MNYQLIFYLITLFALIWASFEDIKNRLVPDKIWGIQIAMSIPLLVLWFRENTAFIPRILVITNIILGFVMGVAFFSFGAFGGGDSKALIACSISLPLYISLNPAIPLNIMPVIFYILTNMFVGFLIFALVLVIYNVRSINEFGPLFGETEGSFWAKFSIMISGRRLARDKIEKLKHEDPAEIFEEKWKLYTPLFSEPLSDEEYDKMEKETREKAWMDIQISDRTYMWTRPQPPGLVFFLFSLITLYLFGSPLIAILN